MESACPVSSGGAITVTVSFLEMADCIFFVALQEVNRMAAERMIKMFLIMNRSLLFTGMPEATGIAVCLFQAFCGHPGALFYGLDHELGDPVSRLNDLRIR